MAKAESNAAQARALREAYGHLAGLTNLPFAQLHTIVSGVPAYGCVEWAELLLERAEELSGRDLQRTLVLAACAVQVLETSHTPAQTRCRGWWRLGTTLRAIGEFRSARSALAHAQRIAEEGSLAPAEKIRVMSAQRSLEYDLGRFVAAVEIGEDIVDLCRSIGDRHREGVAMSQLGLAYLGLGRIDEALAVTRRGFAMVDRERNLRSWGIACQNLGLALVSDRRPKEALDLLARSRDLFIELGDELGALKSKWTQGLAALQISPNLGRQILETVVGAYARRSLAQEACLVALDLADDYIRAGELLAARRIVHQVTPVFATLGLAGDAIAAWMLLSEAVANGVAMGAAIGQVRRLLTAVHLGPVRIWKGRPGGRGPGRPAPAA